MITITLIPLIHQVINYCYDMSHMTGFGLLYYFSFPIYYYSNFKKQKKNEPVCHYFDAGKKH